LYEHLQSDDNLIWGLDNLETGSRDNLQAVINVDISSRSKFYDFANALEPDLVIHCAASYKDPDKWHRDVDTNVAGTINAINVAKHHKAKLIYFQTALPPISSYAISKIAAEQYIKISGLPYLIFRLSNIYGPRNVSGPIPAFYKRLSAGEPCTVVDTVRDMVYIDDLVECVMQAIDQIGRTGTFDVCSGIPVPILYLYALVQQNVGDEIASSHQIVRPDGGDVIPKTSVYDWLPGWAPKTKIEDGIASAVEWYRANGVGETYTHLKVAS
jgi:UDP-glucose 4-epimerase